MPLPLNLAMTPSEITAATSLPAQIAWMACHFSPDGEGLVDLPSQLPEGSMLILDDSIPCKGHSADLVADTLCKVVDRFHCCGVLLDFQRSGNAESDAMITAIVQTLPCPVAVTEAFASNLNCPVFLAPCPLHQPLSEYLRPWVGREIWLEAALCQEVVTVTKSGTAFAPQFPATAQSNSFFNKMLCCRYMTRVQQDRITFTLFDTPETLEKKLETAQSLGVARAVGLYQELGQYWG